MPNIALHGLSSETRQSSSDFCTDTILLNILVIVFTKSAPASILSYLLHEEARKIFCLVSQPKKGQLLLKPGFHMSGKSQTVWDFTVSRPSQILPTNENSKSHISPIVWDERGQICRIGSVSIFPTRPRFLRWLAIIPDK